MEGKLLLHVEVCKKSSSRVEADILEQSVKNYFLKFGSITPGSLVRSVGLDDDINYVRVCELSNEKYDCTPLTLPSENIHIFCHVYEINEDEAIEEDLEVEEGEKGPSASRHWILPSSEFEDLWANLVFDEDIKGNVLDYIRTSFLFAKHNVNKSVVTWNSVMLFHGPPGTGKTTLCKALSQKLAIRLSKNYSHGHLIEINSHSLFSKWFSESGKLVLQMFNKIKEWVADSSGFVCVLIDEVESLTHSRSASLNSTEPSDSLRVVNAVLTQLDHIRRYPNVLILATSNISEAIDIAFADRADLKQYIGPPSKVAIYKIYLSCINELIRSKLICAKPTDIFVLETYLKINTCNIDSVCYSQKLFQISEQSEGLSGRVLRKLPFLAFTSLRPNLWLQSYTPTLDMFLDALAQALQKHISDAALFKDNPSKGV